MPHWRAVGAIWSSAFAQPASAQLEDKPVPMDKAPFHIPVFSNDYLILLNVNIPPGRNTGYHIHYADSVSVNLTPASQTNQNYGSSEVSAPGTGGDGEPGRATFTDVTKNGPRTHKATNVGPTPFHNISFILKNRAPAGTNTQLNVPPVLMSSHGTPVAPTSAALRRKGRPNWMLSVRVASSEYATSINAPKLP